MIITFITPTLDHWDMMKEHLWYVKLNTNIELNTGIEGIEFIVVDDNSLDKTKDCLEQYLDLLGFDFRIIRHEDKIHGFGPSVNEAIMEAQGKYICIWNSDMLPKKNWLSPLLRCLDFEDYGMVSSSLIEPCHMSKEQFFNEDSLFSFSEIPPIEDWAKDGPWMFRKEVFDKVGLFDERFKYGQWEDSDYLLRMAKNGYKFGKCLNSFVYHYSSVTQHGSLLERIGNSYIWENRQKFEDKWGTVHIDGWFEKFYREYKENRK
ncbi:MAG: glycosyltransferase [Phycisphaerae bacterium]